MALLEQQDPLLPTYIYRHKGFRADLAATSYALRGGHLRRPATCSRDPGI
jgi:hypothetical protein